MAAGGNVATKDEHAHPTEKIYIKVALWLGAITAVEIAISYIKMPDPAKIVSLVLLSVIKFTAVVGYFNTSTSAEAKSCV